MSTHTAICYHIVFSTKDRIPALTHDRREDLFRYISGIIRNRQSHLYLINGVEDHLHILTSLHPTIRLADFVKEIKAGSTHWIKDKTIFKKFSNWQEGYGAFTCSQREIDGLTEYIKDQEQHHRKVDFKEEYRKLLIESGIEFDERYLL
jgi:REP element-mobilizing transposase RayT